MNKLVFFGALGWMILGGCEQQPSKFLMEKKQPQITSHSSSHKESESPESKFPTVRVGILDFNKVWHDAKAPEKIRDDIQQKRRAYQREIINLEEHLRREEESLQAQHEKISATDYKKKRKKFEADVLAVQKKVQRRKQRLEKAYSLAMGEIGDSLNKIVEKIAKERKLDLVLSETNVAFSNKELNITAQVIQELDASYPTVKLKE